MESSSFKASIYDGLLSGGKIAGIYTRNQQAAAELATEYSVENYSDIESLIQSNIRSCY